MTSSDAEIVKTLQFFFCLLILLIFQFFFYISNLDTLLGESAMLLG